MSKNKNIRDGKNTLTLSSKEQNQTHQHSQDNRLLKDRFLETIIKGELGSIENSGTVVTLKEFKAYFCDIKTDYINSFLPAATLEPGQSSVSHTRYLFRVRKGAYLVHPDVLLAYLD